MSRKQSSGFKFSVEEIKDIKAVLEKQEGKDLKGMDRKAYDVHVMYLMRKVRTEDKSATKAHADVMASYPK